MMLIVTTNTVTASWAYLDSESLAHINTEYYKADSTAMGTFDFRSLNDSILAKSSPLFIASYDSIIVDSKIYHLLNWTPKNDLLGFWQKKSNNDISSLQIKDFYWPFEKVADSDLIQVSPKKKYIINGSLYIEKEFSLSKSYGYGIYIYWLDGSGNILSQEKKNIFRPPKSRNNFSFDLGYPPPLAKTLKIGLRHSRLSMGIAYFNDIYIREDNKIVMQDVNLSNIPDTKLNIEGDNAIYTLNQSNSDIEIELRYVFERKSPLIKYFIDIIYKENAITDFEKLSFLVNTNNTEVLGRHYKNIKLSPLQVYKGDQWTSKIVNFHFDDGTVSFKGSDNLQSMMLIPEMNTTQLELYIDNRDNHPHPYYTLFYIDNLDKSRRKAGDNVSYYMIFSINGRNEKDSDRYIAKMRQPNGYLASIIFTEHADGEETNISRAIAFGSSNLNSKYYGKKGFLGNNLKWTKSIFIIDNTNHIADALNEKPEYALLIDELYSQGVEIVPHSISSTTDNRSVVRENLAILKKYHTQNWIDHGAGKGRSNLEDLASQGWNKSSEYYILDILDEYGYKYSWGFVDYLVSGLNLLEPEILDSTNPYLYYNNNIDDNTSDLNKIYLWNSIASNKFVERSYTKNNVDKLISEKGISIGHEYFSSKDYEGHSYISLGNDEYEISPSFENELEYISNKVKVGDLWNPTVSQFADYQISSSNVDIIPLKNNKYSIINNNNHTINGISFITNGNGIENILINDTHIKYKIVNDSLIFWFDMQANSEKIIEFI